MKLLSAIYHDHGDSFQWKQPPYEYEYEKLPIDLILGNGDLRKKIEQSADIGDTIKTWSTELKKFINISSDYYLYK